MSHIWSKTSSGILLYCGLINSEQSFPRLKANGPFHRLFGWNVFLRIFFFSSEIGFSWEKSFETCFVYLLWNATQAADNNKVLSEDNKRLVWKFFKNSQLFDISDEKRKFSRHHFSQKDCETYPLPLAF